MNTALILPPSQSFFVPYSAPAVLAEWLRKEFMMETLSVDAGIEWLWYELKKMDNNNLLGKQVFTDLCNGTAYSNIWNLKKSFDDAQGVLSTICDEYEGESIDIVGVYKNIRNHNNWFSVYTDATQIKEKLFDGYIKNKLIPNLRTFSPDIIGLSIPFDWMISPSIRLAWQLKECFPDTTLILGGNVLVRLWNTGHKEFFEYSHADWACVSDGETAFSELISIVNNHEYSVDFKALIKLPLGTKLDASMRINQCKPISNKQSEVLVNAELDSIKDSKRKASTSISLKKGFIPNYSYYPLALYLRPIPIIPIPTSQGCFYGKCNFCSRQREDQKVFYYETKAINVYNTMVNLSDSYGAKQFILADDIVTHRLMKNLSRLIIKNQQVFQWFCEASFKESMVNLSKEEAIMLYEGGCRIILNGLESGSEKIRNKMDIKVDAAKYSTTMHKLSSSGVIPYTTIIFGYPSEDYDDLHQTISFIRDHMDEVIFATSRFYALEGTPLMDELLENDDVSCKRSSIEDGGFEYSDRETIDKNSAKKIIADELPGMFGTFQQFMRSIPVLMQLCDSEKQE